MLFLGGIMSELDDAEMLRRQVTTLLLIERERIVEMAHRKPAKRAVKVAEPSKQEAARA